MLTHRFPLLRVVPFAVLLGGCQSSLEPGDILTGQWASDVVSLKADAKGVTLNPGCGYAVFPAVTLDATRSFVVESTSYASSGVLSLNIAQPNGIQIRLSGNVAGAHLDLTITYIHPPNPDIVMPPVTLVRGGHPYDRACPA